MSFGVPENEPRRAKDDSKRAQESPRWPKTKPKTFENDSRRSPGGSKKRSQAARRKKNRTKTILGSSWKPTGPFSIVRAHPRRVIWEAKTAPKSIPKRSKFEAKNQEEKKSIQDDLGPILGRSWAVLGRHLGRKKCENQYKTTVS